MTLGEKLQRLRKAHGWTQEQLAEKVGISRQSLSGWENDTALPDTVNVIALADLFGVTTDYLLRLEAQPSAEAAPSAAPPDKGRLTARDWAIILIDAIGVIGLVVLRALASANPAVVSHTDERGITTVYQGFSGFLESNDLWWALWLLIFLLLVGLAWGFWPRLVRLGKKAAAWLRGQQTTE